MTMAISIAYAQATPPPSVPGNMPNLPSIKAGNGIDPDIVRQYLLTDQSVVSVYKDGKMSMEDKLGRPISMHEGLVMETKEGGKLMMRGNEIWRAERARNPY